MENKITIGSLASSLAQSTGKSKKLCEDFLKEFFKVVAENMETGEALRIKGFGSFKVVDVDGRTGVNVNTGEKQEIPSYKKVVFTPSKEMAALINSPFEEFDSVELEDDIPSDLLEDETEDGISEYRLEEGSDEEAADDEITKLAYQMDERHHVDAPQVPLEEEEKLENIPIESDPDLGKETQPELEQEPVPLPVYEEYEEPKSRFGIGFLVGALSMFAVCAVIFMLGCFFDWWPENLGNLKNMVVTGSQPVPVETVVEPQQEEVPGEIIQEAEPIYDTVSTTRYLTTIAREHYGNYNFWPYIYLENESILGHPDRITPGTRIVVPDLAKYGVDPQNKEDVKTAKQKGVEIYARFK